MSRGCAAALALGLLWVTASKGHAGEAKTLFMLAAERLPTCVNAEAEVAEAADGGSAVVFRSPEARIGAQLRLEPGDYTLVFTALAPSAERDALYVDTAGRSTRVAVGEFGKWVVRLQAFSLREAADRAVVLRPDPNELGLSIDQVAVVRGKLGALTEMTDLPAAEGEVALEPVSGIRVVQATEGGQAETETPGVREFQMTELPDKAHGRGLDTLFYCSFDESQDADYARGNGIAGKLHVGELAEGKWGKALDCTDPEVNLYFNMYRNLAPRAGTLECWVKSGEPSIWDDGQDHWFFNLTPRLTLPDRPRVGVSMSVQKRGEDGALHLEVWGGATADLSVPVAGLGAQDWHHIAFSWDFTDGRRQLWLCVDGQGRHAVLPVGPPVGAFWCLQIGNHRYYRHYAHVGEYRPLGGVLDDLHISDETLARREAGYEQVEIEGMDQELALAAEDALQKYLDRWAELQLGGAWGDWMDPKIAPNGLGYDWTGRPVDRRRVGNKYGSSGQVASNFLRAYEYTGDERWLQVAVNAADFFVRGQDELGYWYQDYVVDESGGVAPLGATNWARVQDGYQSRRWAYMLYAQRVTGDGRYFESARKCADFVLSIENPNGSWPGTYDTSKGVGRSTGSGGVEYGCEYNDYATTDPMRMMMAMCQLTGDEKYLRGPEGSRGIASIGQWMFDTQIGEGEVRGGCQQYDQDNNPVWARGFEAPVISPRVVNRFIHPMCLWMYLMTGNERYMRLLQETYDWYRSVEVPGSEGGWYYQYLPDGTPVYSDDFKTIRIDPEDPDADAPKPSREKIRLTALERTLKGYQELGPEEFRKSFVGTVGTTPEDMAGRRRAAAEYCRAHADEVREAIAAQQPDGTWVGGSSYFGAVLTRPVTGRAAPVFHYVLNLHLARGVVPASAIPTGGKSPWGGTVPFASIADWFDVPLHEGP